MKKICPYCGRIDELGSTCKGCGYVLQVADKDAPDDVQQDKAQKEAEQQGAVYQKYVYEEFVFHDTNAAPQPDNVVKPSELKMPRKAEKTKTNTVIPKALRLFWTVFGISILAFGICGFFATLTFYRTGDLLNGLVGTSVAVVVSFCGLSCIKAFRNSKFWKLAKYAMIAALIIAIGIPLFLMVMN